MEKELYQLAGFEGPLDLLLHLIEKNEIDIYDIPVAELTDQYMAYISSHGLHMDSMSEFILMAATLLEIKSRLLLPLPVSDEPSVDPRQALVEKLIEYKRFKQAAAELEARGESAYRIFRPPDSGLMDMLKSALEKQPGEVVGELLGDVSLDMLFDVFESVLMRQELKTDKIRGGFNSVKRDVFTVDDKISFIRGLLSAKQQFKFREIFAGDVSRKEIIV
ncbi:MAG: segregation/condensation protein A, partial [Defluviitaleaceae bacterium]|nr:segregation/condensation protein A [Defluviitaleaceae bacterium]